MSHRASAASQPAPEPFVPFEPALAPAAKPSADLAALKVMPKPATTPAFAPLQSPGSPHAHSGAAPAGKPVVTLEREGERVTGIRIECGCGQVIELDCSY